MRKRCRKCGAPLYQAEDLKWFCLECLAREIEEREQPDDTGGDWQVLRPKTRPVTLRLSEADLAKAKRKAREIGKPYQTLLKDVIRTALAEGGKGPRTL